jgi:IclR family mhp operon transcriptional activator
MEPAEPSPAEKPTAEKDYSIRSIARCIAVLQAINRQAAPTLSEIAADTDIPHPTVSRIVRTLIEQGLIEQETSRKRYRPTAMVHTLSCGFQNHDKLVSTARPHIVQLTELVNWPISLVTRVGQDMVVRDSTNALTSLTFTNYYPGWKVPLLPSASGRVYFSYASPNEQRYLLKHYRLNQKGVDELTLRSFESGEAAELIREQGYAAVARTPYSANPGKTSSIAVPLFEADMLLGALSLVFFANGISIPEATRDFLAPLRETADAIGRDMAQG